MWVSPRVLARTRDDCPSAVRDNSCGASCSIADLRPTLPWKQEQLLGKLKPDSESASAHSKWELCLALLEMPQSHLAGSISTPEFAFCSNHPDIPRQAAQSPL